jgi:hypothetical protein
MDRPEIHYVEQARRQTMSAMAHGCFPEVLDMQKEPELRTVMEEVVDASEF